MPPKGDRTALVKVFSDGESFASMAADSGPAVATYVTIVASPWWLTGGLSDLLEELRSSSLPVALVLAAVGDPLGSVEAVQAAVERVRAFLQRWLVSL